MRITRQLLLALAFVLSNVVESDGQCTIPSTPIIGKGTAQACLNSAFPYGLTNYSWNSTNTFAWTFSDPTAVSVLHAPNAITRSLMWLKAGVFKISVVSTNSCGSSIAGEFEVTVHNVNSPPAITEITGPRSICAESVNVYSVPAIAGYSTVWDVTSFGSSNASPPIPTLTQTLYSSNNVLNYTARSNAANGVGGTAYFWVAYSNGYCEGPRGAFTSVEWGGTNYRIFDSSTGMSASSPCKSSTQSYFIGPAIKVGETVGVWSISGGGTISSSGTTANVTWTSVGDYTISVPVTDQCGITRIASHTVNVQAPLIAPSGPTTFCPGGNVTLFASMPDESMRSYTWYWRDKFGGPEAMIGTGSGKTVNADGLYSVSSNNCPNSRSESVAVTVSSPPPATINPSNSSFCDGQLIILLANAGTGLTYQWKKNNVVIPSATNGTFHATTIGTYTVVVSNGACATTSAPAQIEKIAPGLTLSSMTKTLGSGTFQVTASSSSPAPIAYYSSNTNVATISGNTVTLRGVGTTNIQAIQSEHACMAAATTTATLTVTSGSQMMSNANAFMAYPNPANEQLTFEAAEAQEYDFVVSLIDSKGTLVASKTIRRGETKILFDTKDLLDGIYIFKTQHRKKNETLKITIKKSH